MVWERRERVMIKYHNYNMMTHSESVSEVSLETSI